MQLGYLRLESGQSPDLLLARVAERLADEGIRVGGAIQRNVDLGSGLRCRMELELLPSGDRVAISEDLGPEAKGCRLDAGGLQAAAGAAIAAFETRRPELLIVNKFGKQEAAGSGFRDLVAAALVDDVPVLTAVGTGCQPAFDAFTEGLGIALPFEEEAVLAWAAATLAAQRSAATA